MLQNSKLVGFIATVDGDKSRCFYEKALGFIVIEDDEFAISLDCNGAPLRIQKVRELRPQQHTVAGWSVPSIQDVVEKLRRNGVEMEQYGLIEQDESGIWQSPTRALISWFKDPDGNLLSITEVKGR